MNPAAIASLLNKLNKNGINLNQQEAHDTLIDYFDDSRRQDSDSEFDEDEEDSDDDNLVLDWDDNFVQAISSVDTGTISDTDGLPVVETGTVQPAIGDVPVVETGTVQPPFGDVPVVETGTVQPPIGDVPVVETGTVQPPIGDVPVVMQNIINVDNVSDVMKSVGSMFSQLLTSDDRKIVSEFVKKGCGCHKGHRKFCVHRTIK